MRSLIVVVLVIVGCSVESATPAEAQQDAPVATIRIHDYAHIPNGLIVRAQHLVANMYGAIGVETRWAETIRPSKLRRDDQVQVGNSKELLLVILDRDMSRRKVVATGVVGTAAVTIREGGRVAYVLFDRVCSIAASSARNEMDIMGLVMAHEIAHLLLPYGSHSRRGLMRASWSVDELRGPSREAFAFTRAQAAGIRQMLGASPERLSRAAGPSE